MKKKSLLKPVGILFTLLFTLQAEAGFQCDVKPTDDLIVTPQSVRIVGQSGDYTLFPNGEIHQQGKVLTVSPDVKQQSVSYQTMLRQTLPYIDQQAHQYLRRAQVTLDKVIVNHLGSDSQIRQHLSSLVQEINGEMGKVLERTAENSMTFHYKAVEQLERTGQARVEQAINRVLQDSLSEMSSKALSLKGGNPLQAMMSGLGDFQKEVRQELQAQESDFQRFGEEVCQKGSELEAKKKLLINALK